MLNQVIVRGVFVVALLASAASARAQFTGGQPIPAPAAAPKNDYADAKSWLCRPGKSGSEDACAIDHTTTVIAAAGTVTREPWRADANAPIDCFYVYPTISTDATPYSDMNPDPAELNVIAQQFARFASRCRVYAPAYRQVTLAGLTRGLAPGGSAPLDRGLGFDDVKDAWRYYLEHDNNGRGFVLIGHSQGAFVLAELMRQEIDGKPVQARMVSAILAGTTIGVPPGMDVGGTFQRIPLCRSAIQAGCVITFAAFRSNVPPPANSLFGRPPAAGQVGACTNPAALAGGTGDLHAYLSRTGRTITGTTAPKPWVTPEAAIDTPWISVPGLLAARCASNEHANYLEITVRGDAADPRTDDIIGDLGSAARPAANWGLHLVDMNLTMGNLLDVVAQQTKTYLR